MCGLRRCECICGCVWQWGQNSTVKKKKKESSFPVCLMSKFPLPSSPRSQMSFHMVQLGHLFLPPPAMTDYLLLLVGLCIHLPWNTSVLCHLRLKFGLSSRVEDSLAMTLVFSHVTHSKIPVHSLPQLTCSETPEESKGDVNLVSISVGSWGWRLEGRLIYVGRSFFSRVCRHLREIVSWF